MRSRSISGESVTFSAEVSSADTSIRTWFAFGVWGCGVTQHELVRMRRNACETCCGSGGTNVRSGLQLSAPTTNPHGKNKSTNRDKISTLSYCTNSRIYLCQGKTQV